MGLQYLVLKNTPKLIFMVVATFAYILQNKGESMGLRLSAMIFANLFQREARKIIADNFLN